MRELLVFIQMVISFYMWIVFFAVIMSWLIAFDVVNRRNRVVYAIADVLSRLTEPALRRIRPYMPDLGGVDISPVVLFFVLYFIQFVVIGYLLRTVA